jgi:hypothetical protein
MRAPEFSAAKFNFAASSLHGGGIFAAGGELFVVPLSGRLSGT